MMTLFKVMNLFL